MPRSVRPVTMTSTPALDAAEHVLIQRMAQASAILLRIAARLENQRIRGTGSIPLTADRQTKSNGQHNDLIQ